MASGLDSLLEALRNSGMDAGNIGSSGGSGAGSANTSGASESGASKAGGSAKRTSGGGKGGGFGDVSFDLSFLDNFHGPKHKASWVIIVIIALLVIAALYWWFHPPISINSTDLWMIVVVVCAIAIAVLAHFRHNYKVGGGKYEKSPKKQKKFSILLVIPAALIAFCALGALFSNAIIPGNAEKYSNTGKSMPKPIFSRIIPSWQSDQECYMARD